MSPVEMREHPAVAVNPASREIKDLVEEEATVVAAATPNAAAGTAAVEIEAAGKGAGKRNPMANKKTNIRVRTSVALSTLLLAWLFVAPFASADDTATQQVFPSPDAAVTALVAAGKADDMKALSSILGPEADQILSSGDPVADKNARDEFAH